MNPIAGLSTTGRRLHGPASDLVELVTESGYRHTAIVFHPEYRDHQAINSALTVVVGYLESPMVTGMVELQSHDSDEGAFIYPTGQATSVAELNRTFADFGEAPGVRAGLELMFAAGEILIDAAETGEGHGVYSHGGLTPWRLMIKPDGQVQIIGYALPQVEILRFHDDPQSIPREDSFRYCPPERMEAGAEDLSSDLFALALIAFELMTGKPVYDGLVNDIRAMASRAEGSRRLFRFRDQLPKSVQEFLKICLRRDTDDRFPDGDAFMTALQSALGGADIIGPSLNDVMDRAGDVPQRVGTPLQDGGATMMVTREKLAEMVEEQEEVPSRTAWKPPTRKRRASPRAAKSAEPPATAPEPTPTPAPAPEELSSSTDGPKWRRPSRRSAPRAVTSSVDEKLEQPTSPEPPPPEPVDDGPRRASSLASDIIGRGGRKPPARRRAPPRRGGSVDEPAPAAAPAPEAPAPPAPPAPSASTEAPPGAPVRLPVRRRRPISAPAEDTAPPVNLGPPPQAPSVTPAPPSPEPVPTSTAPPPPPAAPVVSAPESAPPPAPPRREPEPEPKPKPRPKPKPKPKTEAQAPAPTPEPVTESVPAPTPAPKKKAPAKTKKKAPPASSPKPTPPVAPSGDGRTARTPDPLPTDSVKGESQRFSLSLGPGTKDRRFRLPVQQPVSEAVAKLVGMLLPLRFDASGRLTGWYRFTQGGVRPAGNPPMQVFDAATPIGLEVVPNQLVTLALRIEHDGGHVTLRQQLGVAVPSSGIVEHVAELLSLPAGRWRLFAGERALHAHEILADLPDLDSVELVIRR